MYSANRTDSRIFDDGEETALRSTSLSELANDLLPGMGVKVTRVDMSDLDAVAEAVVGVT